MIRMGTADSKLAFGSVGTSARNPYWPGIQKNKTTNPHPGDNILLESGDVLTTEDGKGILIE